MPKLPEKPLPLLVALFGLLSAGLFFWSHDGEENASFVNESTEFASADKAAEQKAIYEALQSAPLASLPSLPQASPTPERSPENPAIETASAPTLPPAPVVPEMETATAPPSATPALPTDAELAGPLPESAPVTADPTPLSDTALETPTPQPEPSAQPALVVDESTLAQHPQLWPRQVVLLKPVRFPVFISGKEAGNVQAPPGAAVILRKVRPDGLLELELRGSYAVTPAKNTDVLSRAQAMQAPAQ